MSGLIVTRKPGECIVLQLPGGQEILIEVKKCRPAKCSVRIVAPEEIGVFRGELLHKED